MMSESEFIARIQVLKQIKPRKDWVFLTKKRIFGQPPTLFEESPFRLLFSPQEWLRVFLVHSRLAFATLLFLGILFSTAFTFAQSALPGDFLYPVKRVVEKAQAVFVSEKDKPTAQLELVNKRLEELTQIAQANQAQKLAPAINEFQASASQAAKDLRRTKDTQKITKEVVEETKKLAQNKQKVESLGVLVGDSDELDEALAQVVENQIKDLEKRTLSVEQQETFEKVKESFEAKKFSEALEMILSLNNSNSSGNNSADEGASSTK